VGLDRYLFPAGFIGSIFTAAVLYRLTFQYDWRKTLDNARAFFFRQRNKKTAGALLAVLMFALTFPLVLVYLIFLPTFSSSLPEVIDYLNSETPKDAIIETYDSEIFFLLERSYHYPPDETNVLAIQREFLKQDVPINYNPLTADPDYLVVGNFSRWWEIYDVSIARGEFKFLKTFPGYEIYVRVRD
jgi:hypothetical protein